MSPQVHARPGETIPSVISGMCLHVCAPAPIRARARMCTRGARSQARLSYGGASVMQACEC
eukprot:1917945-Alexandrium_andersonii.AAC.1